MPINLAVINFVMKQLLPLLFVALLVVACTTQRPINQYAGIETYGSDTLIIQSLFSDKSASISEENIQKILEGSYRLPAKMRVALVKLEPAGKPGRSYWLYGNDEDYLKTQQSYLDLFSQRFTESPRVIKTSIIPDLLISKTPSFTNIRESAVRMQADVVVVYSITSDLYSKYKLFSRPDIKAFATTQLIILDVRTGLIPFSTIVTRDILSQKQKEELSHAEAANRIQREAVLLTINEIGQKITAFLNTDK
jgi:hypothetical protein